MTYCAKCGEKSREKGRYCVHCGAASGQDAQFTDADDLTVIVKLLQAGNNTVGHLPMLEHVPAERLERLSFKLFQIALAMAAEAVTRPAVKFVRTSNTGSLPYPKRGDIQELRRFVNVGSDADFRLLVAWLLGALRHRGPYPILAVLGPQGSSKTTVTRIARELVDPVITAPTRSLPRNEQDLVIAMNGSHVLSYDNVSTIPAWLSDALCRIATGAGFATRKLYTDEHEHVIGGARPVILNGIEDFTERPDLVDRTIFLRLPVISKADRRDEKRFWEDFEQAKAAILGALLYGLSVGLANLDETELEEKPRMADFALWGVACEPAFPWDKGMFFNDYMNNQNTGIEIAVDASPIARPILQFVSCCQYWKGTATQLLNELNKTFPFAMASRDWPRNAARLSNRLRRDLPVLSKLGVECEMDGREGDGTRVIILGPKGQRRAPMKLVRTNKVTTSFGTKRSLQGAVR